MRIGFLLVVLAGCSPPSVAELAEAVKAPATDFDDASGRVSTAVAGGTLDVSGPFFQSLGINGRACVTCHDPADAWSITPAHIQARFAATNPSGGDPLFRPVDGAIAAKVDLSSDATRRTAFAMLLQKGLIRISLPVPANADFEVAGIDDPYDGATPDALALFRRPLPSTNLRFLTTVMWDGRESGGGRTLDQSLLTQSNDATQGHAQAPQPIADDVRRQIVDFEMGLHTAQLVDNDAKNLDARQGGGGPAALAAQSFYAGINDPLGGDHGPSPSPSAGPLPFNPESMTLYDAWAGAAGTGTSADGARASIARGAALFGGKPISISGVRGLNDVLGVDPLTGTCTTCHDAPNVGNHSLPLPIDIGLTDEGRRTPDLPLYTLREKATGELRTTTDPGRALVTGHFRDIGKFKGPILRALAARPPYFHNGSAATLDEVVDFYDTRFGVGLSPSEKADLVAFLKAL